MRRAGACPRRDRQPWLSSDSSRPGDRTSAPSASSAAARLRWRTCARRMGSLRCPEALRRLDLQLQWSRGSTLALAQALSRRVRWDRPLGPDRWRHPCRARAPTCKSVRASPSRPSAMWEPCARGFAQADPSNERNRTRPLDPTARLNSHGRQDSSRRGRSRMLTTIVVAVLPGTADETILGKGEAMRH
jgi:hypothetical protein